jgi:hypothetical protein
MSLSFHALYSDGRKYEAFFEGGQTFLRTVKGGRMDVPYFLGTTHFVKYDFDYTPPRGLRAVDCVENMRQLKGQLALFTPPQKPATAPTPIPPSETKVHLEERLPGESRLAQLQRSVGHKELQARANRQREFQEQTDQASQPTARQIATAAEVRRLNNFHARQIRPRGGGGGFGAGFVVEE